MVFVVSISCKEASAIGSLKSGSLHLSSSSSTEVLDPIAVNSDCTPVVPRFALYLLDVEKQGDLSRSRISFNLLEINRVR